jgi:LPS export ABC transporter protein LptC
MLSFIKSVFAMQPQGFFLVVCCIGTLLCTSCENDLSKLPQSNNLKDLEGDKATDVTFYYSEKGITKARLFSKEFIGNEKAVPPYIDLLKGVKLEMLDTNLNIETTVTARTARYYTKDENVIAKDSVRVVNAEGKQLETEELIWNKKLERFYTDKYVVMTIDGQISTGYGLEASQDFKYVRIQNQRGAIPVQNDDIPRIGEDD